MKNLFLWYLPQAVLFFGGVFLASQALPPGSSGYGMAGTGLLLAAAYTGGVNLILNLLDWKARRAERKQRLRDPVDAGAPSRQKLVP